MNHIRSAAGIALGGVLSLFVLSCPLTDDPLTGSIGLNPKLYGVWRFQGGLGAYEEIIINREPHDLSSWGGFIYGAATIMDPDVPPEYKINFAGDIVYAKSFSDSAGILIIKYWRTPVDYKQIWVDWSVSIWPVKLILRDPQPAGDYYGVYFLNLNEAGTRVFLACTNDQSTNSGPTETLTLEEAIAKFTQGNMNQMLDLSVGDPQTRVGD
jgi:hypothetical protein